MEWKKLMQNNSKDLTGNQALWIKKKMKHMKKLKENSELNVLDNEVNNILT